jgi:catechol 2,3-dioxygenase-like lactoylglutathione lyase family enzyme
MARIRHVAIRTTNVERLVKFYMTTFGLEIVEGDGTATYLTDGYLNLAIIPERNQSNEGLNHIGFEVESIDALRPVCQEQGASTAIEKRPPNREAEFRVHDPDGNGIDLSRHGWPH